MKNKKLILVGLVVVAIVGGVIALGSILGNNASDDVVVDSNGKVRTGSNASYAVSREDSDNQLVNDYVESLESTDIDTEKLDPNLGYNIEYSKDDSNNDSKESISENTTTEQPIQNDTLNLYHVDEETSKQYWIAWEQANVEDMYFYRDKFMTDMVVGLLSGNIKYCPMISSSAQDKYANGFIPQSLSVNVTSIDTENCIAVASVKFTDESVKNYNIRYSLNSEKVVTEFIVTEEE